MVALKRAAAAVALALGLLPAPGRAQDPVAAPLPLTEIARRIADPGAAGRVALVREVGEMGSAGRPAIPAVASLLLHPNRTASDFTLRREAVYTLARIGQGDRAAERALVEAIDLDHAGHRYFAIAGLIAARACSRPAVDEVEELLEDSTAEVFRAALDYLAVCGRSARSARDELAELLTRADSQWPHALATLRAVGASEAEVGRALLHALREGAPSARDNAARALEEGPRPASGAAAAPAEPLAESAADSCVSGTPGAAALVLLESIAPSWTEREPTSPGGAEIVAELGGEALPALRAGLDSGDRAVQLAAARLLAGIGPQARPAVPELVGVLGRSADPELRRAAAEALRQCRPAPEGVLDVLVRLLEDRDVQVAVAAARTLGEIGPAAAAAVPALEAAAERGDALLAAAASAALARIR